MNLEMISSILADFGDTPVSVQAEHCLNKRHKGAGCQLCADACPTEAIRLEVGWPHLDAECCVNCGLCLHACPTDVFTQQNAPEPILAETVSLLPDEAVALVCPQHDHPTPTRAPVSTVVRHKRCLAPLSVPQLLGLSEGGRRTIWLDDTPCAECPIGRVRPAIAQTADRTNRLLQAFSRPPAIHMHRENLNMLRDEPASLPVVDGDKPAVSRRGFFSALGQMTRKTAASAVAEILPNPSNDSPVPPVDQRLPHRVPPSRGRLYTQLKRLGKPAEEPVAAAGLPFTDVQVNADACSACGLCARFCPTGALHFLAEDETFELRFRSNICIDCGICATTCPEDAVRFGPQLPVSALIENEPAMLVAGTLIACAGCGEATAARGDADRPRCYSCRAGTEPMVPLRDTAGLMADLRRRLPNREITDEPTN